jgi:hypothetical protein
MDSFARVKNPFGYCDNISNDIVYSIYTESGFLPIQNENGKDIPEE